MFEQLCGSPDWLWPELVTPVPLLERAGLSNGPVAPLQGALGVASRGALPPPPLPGTAPPPLPGAALPPPGVLGAPPSFGGGPTMRAPAQAAPPGQRIDPAQIPRPAGGNEPTNVFYTRDPTSNTTALPPPAASQFVVRDRGNCTPRAMRSTLGIVPSTREMLKQGAMPLALCITPLALPEPDDDPVPVVDFGQGGPVRCGLCKAYMNPFMQFVGDGARFRCNFCGALTDTPHDYVAATGPNGRAERPELCCGTIEIVATPDFMVRPPMAPAHLFLVDVSHQAVATGLTAAACAAITAVLDELQGGERVRVGVATFDSAVQFYSLRDGLAAPAMLVVPDAEHPFCPEPASLVVPLHASRALVEAALEQIPRMNADTKILDSCLGGAIEAAIEVLKAGTGGKIVAFVAALPKVGARPLAPRDQAAPAGEQDPQRLQEPAGTSYTELACAAADFQVSVDVCVAGQGYADAASLRELARHTGGELRHYAPFAPGLDADQLANDLRWAARRPQGCEAVGRLRVSAGLEGWEAVGRLRVSAGLEVERLHGSFRRRTPTDLDFPAISCDAALSASLRYEDRLPDGKEAFAQFALLYTSPAGERRIRVHTLGLPVAAKLTHVFKGADLDAQMALLARSVAAKLPGGTLAAAREAVTGAAVGVLAAYRRYCASQSSSAQLILPEALKLMPLYALALLKCPALGVSTRPDARAAWLARLMTLPGGGTPGRGGPLPLALSGLTAERLEADGFYLLENGFEALLHAEPGAPPALIQALFGLPQLGPGAERAVATLPRLPTPQSAALHAALDEVRRQRASWLRLRMALRGDANEAAFYAGLVEDRSAAGQSYVEYLCTIHRQIQAKLDA
ncbi:hypothetical protein WJX81_007680 [Elliptochloris bilobata]|uniref:Uncharacterized protein n=1 Tax=Elliptochloris bilobata TaxID=381761 RepID=A0AAW1REE3_9CHLO